MVPHLNWPSHIVAIGHARAVGRFLWFEFFFFSKFLFKQGWNSWLDSRFWGQDGYPKTQPDSFKSGYQWSIDTTLLTSDWKLPAIAIDYSYLAGSSTAHRYRTLLSMWRMPTLWTSSSCSMHCGGTHATCSLRMWIRAWTGDGLPDLSCRFAVEFSSCSNFSRIPGFADSMSNVFRFFTTWKICVFFFWGAAAAKQ